MQFTLKALNTLTVYGTDVLLRTLWPKKQVFAESFLKYPFIRKIGKMKKLKIEWKALNTTK